jgi:hypothetical protein
MNWQTKKAETIENLPNWEKFHDYSWENDNYFGKNFPFRRLRRWVEASKNKHIDDVIHDFVNLDWIPKTHKFAHTLKDYIEFDTFMDGKRVAYHCKYQWRNQYYIEDSSNLMVYVHPVTRLVCVFYPPTQKSWHTLEQERLDKKVRILGDYHQLYKLNGIWYELKATKVRLVTYYQNSTYCRYMKYYQKGPKDILLEENSAWQNNSKNPYVKITLKRQLSSKELKKHGLTNG